MSVFYDHRLKVRVRSLLEPGEGLTLLDVACGSGDLFDVTQPCRYIGTDIDQRRVRHAAQDRLTAHVVSDARRLAFATRSADRILAAGLFHHVADDTATDVLAEMARVLKPGGRVVVLDATWPRRWYNVTGLVARQLDDGRFVRQPGEYARLFGAAFEIRSLEYLSRLTLGFILAVLERPATR